MFLNSNLIMKKKLFVSVSHKPTTNTNNNSVLIYDEDFNKKGEVILGKNKLGNNLFIFDDFLGIHNYNEKNIYSLFRINS